MQMGGSNRRMQNLGRAASSGAPQAVSRTSNGFKSIAGFSPIWYQDRERQTFGRWRFVTSKDPKALKNQGAAWDKAVLARAFGMH
jgi:hypothetical protein